MIFRRFLTTIAVLALSSGGALGAPAAKVPLADEALLKAYDAFRAGDAIKLQKFSSQLGGVDVSRLSAISGVNGTKTPPEPMRKGAAEQEVATNKAAGRHEDILTAIERLAELHARGILTEAEFSAKKAELLGRL